MCSTLANPRLKKPWTTSHLTRPQSHFIWHLHCGIVTENGWAAERCHLLLCHQPFALPSGSCCTVHFLLSCADYPTLARWDKSFYKTVQFTYGGLSLVLGFLASPVTNWQGQSCRLLLRKAWSYGRGGLISLGIVFWFGNKGWRIISEVNNMWFGYWQVKVCRLRDKKVISRDYGR